MADKNNIKEELLKQMTVKPDAKSTHRLLARDGARVKRIKWITITTWSLVAICFVVGAFLEYAQKSHAATEAEIVWMNSLMALARILGLLAIVFTVSLYIRSRNLTIRQIQARLANIEMLLKKMAEDK